MSEGGTCNRRKQNKEGNTARVDDEGKAGHGLLFYKE